MPSNSHPLLRDYESHHQNRVNCWLHFVGIPLIVTGLLGLLSQVRMESYGDLGLWLLLLGLGWSLALAPRLFVPYALAMGALYVLGRWLPWPAALGLFLLGWVLQLVGHHVYEKKAPAFLENLGHLLVGPLWIFAKIMGRKL